MICWLSQYVLDYYHGGAYVSEYWQPNRYSWQGGIDYDIHEPYTDGFNKYLTTKWTGSSGHGSIHPDGKSSFTVV